MRMMPVRAGPGFAETTNWTFPSPGPDVVETTWIQGAVLVAVQLQLPPETRTSVMPNPPEAGILFDAGTNDHVHGEAWLTAWSCPAIVSEALRPGPRFGARVKLARPAPKPEAVPIVIQSTGLDAVHAHPGAVDTTAVCWPPVPGTGEFAGETP